MKALPASSASRRGSETSGDLLDHLRLSYADFGVLAILLAIGAFWSAVWQLVSDGARRMQATMTEFERLAAQQAGAAAGPDAAGRTPERRPPFDDGDGDVIVVPEVRD